MVESWWANWTSWAWRELIGGGFIVALGLVLAGWALWGDRARGRRRCPKCWYDLRGTPGLRCSECGHAVKTERRLHKSRRRWRWAAVGLVVQVCGVVFSLTPTIRANGWCSLLPTWVLLWTAPDAWSEGVDPTTGAIVDPAGAELYRRGAGISLSPQQWRFVLEHNKVMRTRSRWPVNVPLVIDMRIPEWLGECEIKIKPLLAQGLEAKAETFVGFCGNALAYQLSEEAAQIVGAPQSLAAVLPAEFKIIRSAEMECGDDYRRVPLEYRRHQGSVNLPIQIVETIHDAIEPVSTSEATEAVRKSINIAILADRGTTRPVGVDADWGSWKDAGFVQIALRVAVEFVRDGESIETVRMEPDRDQWTAEVLPRAYQNTIVVRSGEFDVPTERQHWSIRVRGDAELALQDWDKPKYWAGEFTVPLSEVLVRE